MPPILSLWECKHPVINRLREYHTLQVGHSMVYKPFPGPVLIPVAVQMLRQGGVLSTPSLEVLAGVGGDQHNPEVVPHGPSKG